MYHDGNAASNTSTLPTPRGSITPVTMAKAFCPIEKTPPVSPGAQSTQVLYTQALNLQVAEESTVRKPMLVKIVEQPMDQSDLCTAQTQRQLVTLVSFASTTQVDQSDSSTAQKKDSLLHWLVLHPLHKLGWTWWSLQLLVR